jgi:hypothetical protein
MRRLPPKSKSSSNTTITTKVEHRNGGSSGSAGKDPCAITNSKKAMASALQHCAEELSLTMCFGISFLSMGQCAVSMEDRTNQIWQRKDSNDRIGEAEKHQYSLSDASRQSRGDTGSDQKSREFNYHTEIN